TNSATWAHCFSTNVQILYPSGRELSNGSVKILSQLNGLFSSFYYKESCFALIVYGKIAP
ncbi:MAG: hypothetical protein KDI13_10825, partial [Alphaproteobacteria bacterium]|nr:hypothetical protein [Alphaproteobacteria bacterium]